MKVRSLSRVRLFMTPWTVTHHAPPSMGFSRQECWSRLPLPSPEDMSTPVLFTVVRKHIVYTSPISITFITNQLPVQAGFDIAVLPQLLLFTQAPSRFQHLSVTSPNSDVCLTSRFASCSITRQASQVAP